MMEEFQHEQFMRRAIELSIKGSLIEKSGGVFGAVIVKDGKVIGEGYNQVIKRRDPTWHAEMQAIREACLQMKSPHLDGCILYTNAECCPMCLAAAYWAHIKEIYYASTVEDAKIYGNFQDVDLFDEIRKEANNRTIPSKQILHQEAIEVWKKFASIPDHLHY